MSFYATAACIGGNTFYLSRARVVSPAQARPRLALAIKTGAIATLALGGARPDSEVSVEEEFYPASVASISGAIDLSIK
jgi:hypothetical protein